MTKSDTERFEAIKKKFLETSKLTGDEIITLIDLVNTIELELTVARGVGEKNLTLLRYYEKMHNEKKG